ncbi:MAG: hypothetical protein IJ826_04440 [Bacteroidaceae bacterium]|nr:hypothetical protein [Bacteroidaceae bacterium]
MITEEQIKWVAPVFKEACAILDKIPDLPSNDYYREERLNNSLNCEAGDYEFFFVEDIGLYKIIDQERGQLLQEVYGRTKREIIQHIVDKYISDDAYMRYAAQRFWEIYPKCPLPFIPGDVGYDQYRTFANERLSRFRGIIAPYINSLEDIAFPANTEEETLKLLKQGKYISLFSKGSKRIVKVTLPDIQKYWRSSCFLGVLHEEEGCHYGVSYEIHERENSAIDISRFSEWAEFLTLRVGILRDNNKIDDQVLERLDIDKKNYNTDKWYTILKKGISFGFRK